MNVTELIAEVDHHVPPHAAPGTRHAVEGLVGAAPRPQQVRVAARIDPQGRRRETCLLDGIRVERGQLLRLTCPQQACPHAQAMRRQWQAFHRRRAGLTAATADPRPEGGGRHEAQAALASASAAVHRFSVAGHQCEAVASRLRCWVRCPNGAHPPMQLELPGHDLYEDGRYLAGGLVRHGSETRPRLPTAQSAEAYVLARQLEAQSWIATAMQGERNDPSN